MVEQVAQRLGFGGCGQGKQCRGEFIDMLLQRGLRVIEQQCQRTQGLRLHGGGNGFGHDQTSRMAMVRRFLALNSEGALSPSEQPLPKVKPQDPLRSKAFSAYSRWVVGMTKRSS